MAKGKRAVALFEVIQRDKRFQRKTQPQPISPSGLSAPPAPPPQNVSVAPAAEMLIAAKVPERLVSADSAARKDITPNPPVAIMATIRKQAQAAASPPKPPGPDLATRISNVYRSAKSQLTPGIEWIKPIVVEHQHALLGVFGAICVCGAILLARQSPRPIPMQIAQATPAGEDLTSVPHPAVLQLDPANTPSADNNTVADSADTAALSADQAVAQPASSIFTPAARQVNLNYVLVQSYGDEKTATEARDFLNANGVPCTIEQGVKGWRKDFYLVIGLQGFPRASGPEYTAYRSKLEALSAQFAPSPHSYKRFDPMAIKWDGK
jgi:hypothetical protein